MTARHPAFLFKRRIQIITIFVCVFLQGCFVKKEELNQAVARGDEASVKDYLARGWDVNGRGMHGMMPLMIAAKTGRTNMLSLLIEKGADVNSHNDSANALMWAISSGNEDSVRLLLQAGPDLTWTNVLGETAE